jgi:hypothetical protein
MNGGHVAGSSAGAIIGIALAALDTKIGLHLTTADAATVAVAVAAVGLGIGHALGKAWAGPGIIPALRRGFLGARKE